MKKILLSCCLSLVTTFNAYAQDAKAILDKTASTLKSAGGIQAHFQTTSYKGNQANGTAEGDIWLDGSRFKVYSEMFTSWYDGKTQWTLMGGSNELNISTPTEAERQSINPYAFVNIYKNGYQCMARNVIYNGMNCHEVQMTAKDHRKELQEVRLIINPQHLPVSIRMKQKKGDWIRIRVSNIRTKQRFNSSFFRFNEKDYPQVEIVDLR